MVQLLTVMPPTLADQSPLLFPAYAAESGVELVLAELELAWSVAVALLPVPTATPAAVLPLPVAPRTLRGGVYRPYPAIVCASRCFAITLRSLQTSSSYSRPSPSLSENASTTYARCVKK
jgi:hypothetical protein